MPANKAQRVFSIHMNNSGCCYSRILALSSPSVLREETTSSQQIKKPPKSESLGQNSELLGSKGRTVLLTKLNLVYSFVKDKNRLSQTIVFCLFS